MNTPPLQVTVAALLVGRTQAYGPNGELSAIAKTPVAGAVAIGPNGLQGDQQGDTRHHGGPDKAVHHYAAEHYPYWHQQLPPATPQPLAASAFGENLSTTGITEQDVCIDDIFKLGTAVLQVSQARQPCWKLNSRFGVADMALRVQSSGKTGWYYRVLTPGHAQAGDTLTLLERPQPHWPLSRLQHYLYTEPLNPAALTDISLLPNLPTSWRNLVQARLNTGQLESWTRRMSTPAKQ
jgi:MOSC domain-containing protein YiiM